MSVINKLYLNSPCIHKKDNNDNFCVNCGALLYEKVK